MKIKTELYHDNFQNYKRYNIPKAQLVIADIEKWKDIPEYKGIYQASNKGNIRSLDRYVDNQSEGKSKRLVKGRILKPFISGAGYKYVTLSVKQKKVKIGVHRLVAQAFLGESNLTVNHKNENKKDNRLINLEYCTQKENCNKGTRNKRLSNIKKDYYRKTKIKRDEKGRFIPNE